jgi:hypothetical protein
MFEKELIDNGYRTLQTTAERSRTILAAGMKRIDSLDKAEDQYFHK